MELLYLWINHSNNDCIMQQQFNFSPLYKFKVDNLKNPQNFFCDKNDTINLFNSTSNNGKINNITAVVGSNGAGKTTLLSFIANNNCFSKSTREPSYIRADADNYKKEKSIYVFIENEKFIVYYNLEKNLNCNFIVMDENLYWNKRNKNPILPLNNVRQQLIVYLSNSSIVPDPLLNYSRSDKTYNVNLHQRSMNLVANNFYKALFGKKHFDNLMENDGFAWIINKNRNDRNFQELLDIQYYQYLLKNKINDFAGIFKYKIGVYFENVIELIKKDYHDDFEIIKASNENYYKISGQKPDKEPSGISKKYYKKINDFIKHYNFNEIEVARRNNCTVVLYVNLLFEAFFNDDSFILPNIDFDNDIYEQINNINLFAEYKKYLLDIKNIEDVLSLCPMHENIIDNPDDLACSYHKIVFKDNAVFYNYISDLFKKRMSYSLRYIRIKNLAMSSGERAMQNMFSWLVLIPELDEIMGMNRSNYTSKLLLIDEIDLYAHPEWQRKIISQLISTINEIEKEKPVQIVVTSHSPFILSDFPRQNKMKKRL